MKIAICAATWEIKLESVCIRGISSPYLPGAIDGPVVEEHSVAVMELWLRIGCKTQMKPTTSDQNRTWGYVI